MDLLTSLAIAVGMLWMALATIAVGFAVKEQKSILIRMNDIERQHEYIVKMFHRMRKDKKW